MNGAAIIDEVMELLGKFQTKTSDTTLRAAILSRANRVREDISGRHPYWTWLEKTATFSTVEDQLSYDVPSDIDTSGRKTISLKQTATPAKLTYRDQNIFDLLEPDPTSSTGNPRIYTIYGGSIRLWPTPSSVIDMTLRYLRLISALDDSATDVADMPDKYKTVLIDGILSYFYRVQQGWGNPRNAKIDYESGIQRMIDDNNMVIDASDISGKHPEHDISLPHPFHMDLHNAG